MAVHPGSWDLFGLQLPDLGITEAVGSVLGAGTTGQGGSDIIANAPAPDQSWSDPTLNTVYNQNVQLDNTQPAPVQTTSPVQSTQVVNPTPQPTQTTQSPDDIWQSVFNQVYPGWGATEAYADWSSKGKPMPQSASNPSVADLEAQLTSDLNSAYQPAMDVLGQQEDYLRGAQPGAEQGIQDQFGLRKTEQEGNLASTQEQSVLDQRKQWEGKEDVLASSRRLYDELRRRNSQRFGGASSAGEAMNTLLGNEQQRQMAQTQRTFMSNIAELEQNRAEVDRSYKQNMAQLNLAKDEAMRKSKDTFTAGLMQIMSSRAGLETEKGLRRLDLLTNLRDQISAAQQSQAEWTQKLDYQRELASMNFNYRLQEIQAQASYKTYAPTKSSYSVVDYGGEDRIMDKTTGSFLNTAQGQIGTNPTYNNFYGLDEEV